MKKHKLDVADSVEFVGLAITTPAKDYQLCYYINLALDISLDKSASIYQFNPKTKQNTAFEGYSYPDRENRRRYYVFKNREESKCLLPPLKQVDYIFLLKGANVERSLTECKKAIGAIPNVQNVFIIETQYLTNISSENNV